MNNKLSKFRLEGLHGSRTYDVDISDNRIVLVGENGTGKSTLANFIYFFLSRQWHRMYDYDFRRIVAVLGSREVVVERSDIFRVDPEMMRSMPPRRRRELENLLSHLPTEDLLHDRDFLLRISRESDVPFSIIREYLLRWTEEGPSSENLRQMRDLPFTDQILYLPTYRRIEQDIRAVFPGIPDDIRRQIRERVYRRSTNVGYVELVEFGMEDVEETIKRKMVEIKDEVRNGLSSLTGTYLRDVINRNYRTSDLVETLTQLDGSTIDAIFSRIPKTVLTEQEQNALKRIVNKIITSRTIDNQDEVIAHFLTQLVDLHKSQQQNELTIREFVAVCNKYLSGKEIIYDHLDFEIYVTARRVGTSPATTDDRPSPDKIEMKMLSSGEKQIISLFSHIYFSGESGFFIVIDEPELSLSVPWQKRFLPDIIKTNRCNGLLAVTHSPFIFENELDSYTHSIEEFMEYSNVVR